MGKAQSKRSVDITTEPTKEIQEGSGKLEKIDDKYFKENESSDKENKVENDAVENEKNEAAVEATEIIETTGAPSISAEVSPAVEAEENKQNDTITSEKPTEEINGETAKPKKEKVKKKWSFRSISFSKKDKQKPSKKDKKNDDNKAVAENVEEKVTEESTPVENGDDKPQEVQSANEDKPQVVAEEKPSEIVESKVIAETTPEKAQEVIVEEPVKNEEPVAVVQEIKPVEIEITLAPIVQEEPVVVEPVKEEPKIVEPVIVEPVIVVEETKKEEPLPVVEVVEEPEKIEVISQPIVEEPPAIPASPPPSQFSVFAESMNVPTTEELPAPAAEVEEPIVEMEIEIEQVREIDVEPVAELIEKVLEEAVDRIEAAPQPTIETITEEPIVDIVPAAIEEESLPEPPSELFVEVPANEPQIIQPEITEKLENGVHHDEETPEKQENGVKEPELITEVKKEDKVADKISPEQALAPEIISE